MILKIARHTDTADFWLLDNVAFIEVWKSRVYKDAGDCPETESTSAANIFIGDHPEKDKKSTILQGRYVNGQEFILGFDTVLYILNNDGVVLERLVANFS